MPGGDRARGTRQRIRAVRLIVAGLSVLVLGLDWYGWGQLQKLTNGLATADVIGAGAAGMVEQNILLVGVDSRTDAQGNPLPQPVLDQLHAGSSSDGGENTDTMIVVHIPASGGAATGASIPRDAYVDLADGFGKHKINTAYTYGKNAAAEALRAQGVSGPQLQVQAAELGARTAIKTVQQLTGLTINHFAAVNLAGFYEISQAIGGVPVCLKNPVRDSYSGADFPAGPVAIQGGQALAFIRQRHGLPNGDLDRVRRQQAFIASMAHTVLSTGTLTDPSKLDNLASAVKKAVTVDQGWDVLGLAQQLQRMSAGNITFTTIPIVSISLQTPEDGDAVQVDPPQVRAFFHTLTTPDDAHHSANGDHGSAAVTVDVRNATTTTGLAAQTRDELTARGFTTGETTSERHQARSSIHYPPGADNPAQALAQNLGTIPTELDTNITNGHLQLYLGDNHNLVITYPHTTPPGQPPPPITASGQTCID